MIIRNDYDYKSLDRLTAESGTRVYLCPITGVQLPSVTTILSKTGDKSGLEAWKKRTGEEKAEQIRKEAAAIGTLLHTHMECFVQDIARPKGGNYIYKLVEKMADKMIEDGLSHVKEVLGFEIPLFFPGLYAGTSDLVGWHQGELAIIDYKNAKKIKKKEMITDYFCQCAAYALAHNELYGTNIKKIVIMMVSREMDYKEFVIEGDEFYHFAELWMKRVIEFQEMGGAALPEGEQILVETLTANG